MNLVDPANCDAPISDRTRTDWKRSSASHHRRTSSVLRSYWRVKRRGGPFRRAHQANCPRAVSARFCLQNENNDIIIHKHIYQYSRETQKSQRRWCYYWFLHARKRIVAVERIWLLGWSYRTIYFLLELENNKTLYRKWNVQFFNDLGKPI